MMDIWCGWVFYCCCLMNVGGIRWGIVEKGDFGCDGVVMGGVGGLFVVWVLSWGGVVGVCDEDLKGDFDGGGLVIGGCWNLVEENGGLVEKVLGGLLLIGRSWFEGGGIIFIVKGGELKLVGRVFEGWGIGCELGKGGGVVLVGFFIGLFEGRDLGGGVLELKGGIRLGNGFEEGLLGVKVGLIIFGGGLLGGIIFLGMILGGGGFGLDTGEGLEKEDGGVVGDDGKDGVWLKSGGLLGFIKEDGGGGIFCGGLSCKFWKFWDKEGLGIFGKLGL